jgi:cyclopropane fatty-acyl-phospholipid synthase-like methyltransferase
MRPAPPFTTLTDYPPHRAFVGQPQRYDVGGASQFALLFLLGLRAHHRLLDFGCGSLRLGRLAIPYLDPDGYLGVEPDLALVEAGFAEELGQDARTLKRPRFGHGADFRGDVFDTSFDFIIAQSVFSHMGQDAMYTALRSFSRCLEPGGLIVANWLLGSADPRMALRESPWVYPHCSAFMPEEIEAAATDAGLVITACPWPHPGLNWFILARDAADLPDRAALSALRVSPPDWS